MSDALRKKLEQRIKLAEREIASKQGTIARARLDLADLDGASARLSKQREKVITRKGAAPKIREVKGAPAPLPDEVPTHEMDLSGSAVARIEEDKKENKKNKSTLFG